MKAWDFQDLIDLYLLSFKSHANRALTLAGQLSTVSDGDLVFILLIANKQVSAVCYVRRSCAVKIPRISL